jgi:hypothetical protein
MKRRKARDVEILQMNAAAFAVPPDATVLYFFNPFGGLVLERVVANIHRSFMRHPRRVHIVYVFDDNFAPLVRGQSWIAPVRRFRFYPHLEGGIYETRP